MPLSVAECRCGWERSRVPLATPRAGDPARGTTHRPWEMWVAIAVGVIVLAWGVYWVVRPPRPPNTRGILGYVDQTPPPPTTAPQRR